MDAPEAGGFESLGLDERLVETVRKLGYERPSPIQREAIPPLLAGRDMLGQAATGTGKTAAFALPLLQRLANSPREGERPVRGLIVVPTRELAMQVAQAVSTYGAALGIVTVAVFGGQSFSLQIRALRRGADIVVATPGRATDHLKRETLSLGAVETVVLDEADEMLDMGFADELEALLGAVPAQRQTALFSATMAPRIAQIAEKHMRDPARISVAREAQALGEAPRVREIAYAVPRSFKAAAVLRIVEFEDVRAAIAFCRTRAEVDEIGEVLVARGLDAATIHGGLSQEQRDRVLRKFRDGETAVLIATDVAARGLDIAGVTHVINVDVPASPDAYVHRIGRTGRAGRTGTAITLVDPREFRSIGVIERVTKRTITFETLPDVARMRAERVSRARATLEAAIGAADRERFAAVADELARSYDTAEIATGALAMLLADREAAVPDVEFPRIDAPSAPAFKRTSQKAPSPVPRAKKFERPQPPARAEKPHDEKVPRKNITHEENAAALPAETPGSQAVAPRKRFLKLGTPAAAPSPQGNARFSKLFIGVGKNAGVRPADLTGAIANEANLRSRDIGKIEVTADFSLVEVPEDSVERVIKALRRTTIRGQKPEVRRDRGRTTFGKRKA